MDLHCGKKKHGELLGQFLEIKCTSRYCGAGEGVVVIHRFDLTTGGLVSTKKYKQPPGGEDGARRQRTAVRSA